MAQAKRNESVNRLLLLKFLQLYCPKCYEESYEYRILLNKNMHLIFSLAGLIEYSFHLVKGKRRDFVEA